MMTKKIILLSLVIASCLYSQGQVRKDSFGEKPLTKGLKISRSVKIKKETYKLDAPTSMDGALIVIEGNNITVDFNNAVLKGSNLNLPAGRQERNLPGTMKTLLSYLAT